MGYYTRTASGRRRGRRGAGVDVGRRADRRDTALSEQDIINGDVRTEVVAVVAGRYSARTPQRWTHQYAPKTTYMSSRRLEHACAITLLGFKVFEE